MKPATTYPQRRDDVRLLVIDPPAPMDAALRETRTPALPDFLAAGDLLIVNDAATVPASLRGRDDAGNEIEARLIAARADDRFSAVLFGAGDWHQRTEDRPPPAALPVGARLRFGALVAEIVARAPASPRLVDLRFAVGGDALWAALYREGRPIQYSYLAHDLPLWAVQTVYAARPWAFEMPSAGRPAVVGDPARVAAQGRALGVAHARGGAERDRRSGDRRRPAARRALRDPGGDRARRGRDARPRRPRRRRRDDRRARARGRGDEGRRPARRPRRDRPRHHPQFRPRVVDGILSGAHAAHESHFSLLAAFAGPALLAAAADHADRAGFLTHELGDSMLVLPGALAAAQTRPSATETAR